MHRCGGSASGRTSREIAYWPAIQIQAEFSHCSWQEPLRRSRSLKLSDGVLQSGVLTSSRRLQWKKWLLWESHWEICCLLIIQMSTNSLEETWILRDSDCRKIDCVHWTHSGDSPSVFIALESRALFLLACAVPFFVLKSNSSSSCSFSIMKKICTILYDSVRFCLILYWANWTNRSAICQCAEQHVSRSDTIQWIAWIPSDWIPLDRSIHVGNLFSFRFFCTRTPNKSASEVSRTKRFAEEPLSVTARQSFNFQIGNFLERSSRLGIGKLRWNSPTVFRRASPADGQTNSFWIIVNTELWTELWTKYSKSEILNPPTHQNATVRESKKFCRT